MGRVLRVLARDADHLPPAHDENNRQQDIDAIVQTRLQVMAALRLHGNKAVNGAAAGKKLGNETRHRDLPICLGDKRGHGTKTDHDVASVTAEDHIATGFVRLRQRDEIVKHERDDVGQRHWSGNESASGRQGRVEQELRISVGETVRVRVGKARDVEGDGAENRRNGDHQEPLLHHAEVVLQEEESNEHGDDGDVHE